MEKLRKFVYYKEDGFHEVVNQEGTRYNYYFSFGGIRYEVLYKLWREFRRERNSMP